MATSDSAITVNGKEVHKDDILGNDCSGLNRRKDWEMVTKPGTGLATVVADEGRGKWPLVSKSPAWEIGGSDMNAWDRDWGRSEKERDDWSVKRCFMTLSKVRSGVEKKQRCHTRALLEMRTAWLIAHPTWWEEKRREAEVDASSQVAGETTDMNLDNKAIVAGHLAKTFEGC